MKKTVKRYALQLEQNKDQRQRILKEFSLMLDRQVMIMIGAPAVLCISMTFFS